jgi:hypothetical protein
LRESQLWQVQDSHLGVLGQNAIWMWALWRGTKYTITGKVVDSPKFGPWWILWVQVCPWLVLAPKVLQLCTNHLVFGFVQVRVNSWCLSFFLIPSQSSNTPLYPQSAMSQGVCPDSLLFCCFQYRFTFESIKELGNMSTMLNQPYNIHVSICELMLKWQHFSWRAPKFLVRPKKGPTMLKSGSSWNLVLLPASSTKGGVRRACWKL